MKTFIVKNWMKKFKLKPKEILDKNDLIIFKNKELAEEWSKKHVEPKNLRVK